MKTSVAGTRLAAPAKIQQSRARVATPVAASLRQEVARVAKGAGVGIASLGLALAANAATVKLGADGGGLVFDPSSVTIKAGESVTWTNNVGFPHNVVFDEDDVPVSYSILQVLAVSGCCPNLTAHAKCYKCRRVLRQTTCPTRTT